MELKIKEINEKNIWQDFFLNCREKTFLQSWHWGEFNKRMSNKIWRLGVYEKDDLIAVALISKIKAKRGSFLLIQHGPSLMLAESFAFISRLVPWDSASNFKFQILNILLEELKKIGKEERVSFIRMNPLWQNNQENQEILKKLGFRQAPMHANAYEGTLRLELSGSEEILFKNMRKTTRYLIRKAAKNQDISIEKSKDIKDIEKYQNLNKKVAKRKNFIPFSKEYIKNEFQVFENENDQSTASLFFFGKYKKELIASALIIFWSKIAFYHQAASSFKHANLSIPYLILWEAIKEAKKRDCLYFDFWGYINPEKYPEHPWAGPSLFKMGFDSQPKEYLKTQDFPLSKKYWLIYAFEKVRSIKRGLGR